jgi:glycosyltransferase involved in cell wall biosynthesis
VPSQISLIESGIDVSKFAVVNQKKREQMRQMLGIRNEPVLGIIARLSDVKGQDVLLKAFPLVLKQHPQAKLLLVGEGKLEPLLRKIVQELNLENNVIFKAVINETKEYLDCLDIFVMPSRNEGLGLSIMEAQACGLPVVASRVGGIPSLIEDGQTGFLVPPENIEELALKLRELLNNPQKAKEMGLRAKEFAQNHYAAEKMVEKTEDVYKKILNND